MNHPPTYATPRRPLGRSGSSVQAMALGCYSMSSAYGRRDDDESLRVIRRAVERGIDLIDTADFYGWGHNEGLVARALQGGLRERVLLSTKFGYVRAEGAPFALCSEPAYVKAACDASLQRLGTDRIDLYFQHRLDPRVPIEDTVGAMSDLVRAGKVRHLGLCEVSAHTLRRACAVHPISALQIEYSLWTRDPEAGLLQACNDLGVTPMAFSPLARGMLAGQLRSRDQLAEGDVRRKYPRFSADNFPRNLALVDRLGEIAAGIGCTRSQLALAWLYASAPRLVALCGSDTLAFLDENLGALDLRLAPELVAQVGELFAPGRVAGDRYYPALMQMLDRS